MLLGLVHPTSGSVRLMGQEVTEQNRIRLLRHTGSLIESPSGYLHLTAQENLQIIADLKDVKHTEIERVLDVVHLTQDKDKKVGQYSLGMKQRLGIAMALLGNPEILILDEPTNGLDPAGIQEMRALIAGIPGKTGATVLISSHLLGEMEQMVNRVGIIHHGKTLFDGSLQALRKHSQGDLNLRVLNVLKAMPILQRRGLPNVQKDGVLTLPPMPDFRLAEIVQELADSGAGVVELIRHTKSLEDIFLSLTESTQEVREK